MGKQGGLPSPLTPPNGVPSLRTWSRFAPLDESLRCIFWNFLAVADKRLEEAAQKNIKYFLYNFELWSGAIREATPFPERSGSGREGVQGGGGPPGSTHFSPFPNFAYFGELFGASGKGPHL